MLNKHFGIMFMCKIFEIQDSFANLIQGKHDTGNFLKIGGCATHVNHNCLFCHLRVKLVEISNLISKVEYIKKLKTQLKPKETAVRRSN